ncbi:MAG: peptidoglycan DD-metalloendopeptidase family protein [Candidatus Eiseniibacteriota bacterium]
MAVDRGTRGRSKRISFAIETHAPVRAATAARPAVSAPASPLPTPPAARRAVPALDAHVFAPLFLAVGLAAAVAVYLGTAKPMSPARAIAALTATAAEEPAPAPTTGMAARAPATEAETADANGNGALDSDTGDLGAAPATEQAALPETADKPAETPASAEPEQQAALPDPVDHLVKIGRGDTLMDVLRAGGVPADEAYDAITALRPVYDPRKLQIGQQLALTFGPLGTEPNRFLGFRLDAAVDRVVTVGRDETGFLADVTEKPLTTDVVRGEATIKSSLYVAGVDLGIPPAIMIELIHLYSFDVDFQRDIQPGDAFAVMYENQYDESGKAVQQGDIIYAALTLGGQTLRLYRYKPGNGDLDYFNEKGESARKALLRTPVDGARISSGFGMREHPVLGYSRMHKGVDFAVPPGTPIYAAGSGTVEMAGIYGGYGRYVRIRHNSDYSTAYGHMSGFGAGIHGGTRVHQGQIIGYVGSSGLATGPHLHYEVLRDGTQINPMGLKLPSGQKLARTELAKFQKARADVDHRFASLVPNSHIAARDDDNDVASADGQSTACAATAKGTGPASDNASDGGC